MQKISIIVLATDSKEFLDDKIFDENWCKNFPGSAWIIYLKKLLKPVNLRIVSVDSLKAMFADWDIVDFSSVGVIGEPLSNNAKWLISKGATPLISINAESPIYAYDFYDNFKSIDTQYFATLTFKGLRGKEALFFPSFHRYELKEDFVDWNQRRMIALVAGNKSGKIEWRSKLDKLLKRLFGAKSSSTDFAFTATSQVISGKKWTYIFRQLCYEAGKIFSVNFKTAIKNELHSTRLEAIVFFGKKGMLDLYGGGWDEYERYPSAWRDQMKHIVPKVYRGKCEDKLATISKYKFVFCAENTTYLGYVTEKIIDCFVAGVIPIYVGAPDICDFISKEIFVDLRDYDSFEELETRILNMTDAEANKMIESGRNFLSSEAGRKFSYEAMAERIFDIVKEYNDSSK